MPAPAPSTTGSRGAAVRWAALALVLAVAAVYANSFRGAFVFDDIPAIRENPTLRHPADLGSILAPPGDQAGTVGGRPLVNLSLALNFAISGLRPWSYHAFNLLIHALATLALFGVVRRTVAAGQAAGQAPGRRETAAMGGEATWSAFAAALLWALHPLQTEAVTYVVQRTESMAGLFYLLTLYCFIRAVEEIEVRTGEVEIGGVGTARRAVRVRPLRRSESKGGSASRLHLWLALSWTACLLGMASKEVMVSAPVIVFLYDRTFVAGSFGKAWRARRSYYLALGATWLLLAALVAQTHGRGGSAGFESSAAVWPYLLTQCRAVALYLRLALWPQPLVFDHGTALVADPSSVLPQGLLVLALLAGTAVALVRRPALGFLGAWFFGLLAPSSSFIPVATEPIAEHRMYLPLAAVVVTAVGAAAAWAARRAPALAPGWFGIRPGCGLVLGAAAVALGSASAVRNRAYRSEVALWKDTVAKMPGNPRAHNDLGTALDAAGDHGGAAAEFAEAVRVDPSYAPAQYNDGVTLLDAGRAGEALPHLRQALSAPRHRAELRLYLAEALSRLGRYPEAAQYDRQALELEPANLEAAFDLGNNLAAQGLYPDAAEAFRRALELAPTNTVVGTNLANALLYAGRIDEAIDEYRRVLRLKPGDAFATQNLYLALRVRGGRAQLR